MGDRGNIRVVQKNNPLHEIYIYSRWCGGELPAQLRESLSRARERWQDASYLTRILITDICQPAGEDLTGYGVSIARTDNERDVLEVNIEDQMVRLWPESDWYLDEFGIGEPKRQWTFEEYVDLLDFSLPET